jgi:hypothetical protein
MALIDCPECKTQVSATAHKCPKCGFAIRIPKRGFFGKVFKWSFVLWNILMLWWLVAGMRGAAQVQATGDAEEAGRAIGTALGAGMIIGIWVAGAVILGLFVLFTRPRT